jgi:polyphosphate kinase
MLRDVVQPGQLINREISLLEFQRRVLLEAEEESNPLLERVKFLSILYSNLDEFFMVRVAGLRKQVDAHVVDVFPDGLNPSQVLESARTLSLELYEQGYQYLEKRLRPRLEKAGVVLLDYGSLTPEQKRKLTDYFQEIIFPRLSPLAFDPAHPFPHISGQTLNLAVIVKDANGENKFACLQIPENLPRFVPVEGPRAAPSNGTVPHHSYFVWLEQVVMAHLESLFEGMQIIGVHPFRLLRDADLEIPHGQSGDLLQAMQRRVYQSKFAPVVQVAVTADMPVDIRNFLLKQLQIRQRDLYVLDSPLGLEDLYQLFSTIDQPDLKFPPYQPFVPEAFRNGDDTEAIFAAIREKDILIHRPYDAFTSIANFLFAAARDPQVLTIKQTVYRLEDQAIVIEALQEASRRGKEVIVLVELQARFDEESNINWARTLERAGVHVVYGMERLKTHCKAIMVVRQEPDGLRRYMHLSTGNYNAVTSMTYEDVGFFTCDPVMGEDVTDLFNFLTGFSRKMDYQRLFVAPLTLRPSLERLIRREINVARQGGKARLIFKANALVDLELIKLLYEASQAGVQVDLLIRGICCLLAGVKGLSENIRVVSIIGRYLEHSRIYYFYNQGKEEIYLSSADLMPRNLDYRVETMFPLRSPGHLHYLRDEVLENYLRDDTHAHLMQPDGSYECRRPSEQPFGVQEWLMEIASKREH